jgi:GrpB-like predicted nucleotidyltransferase (UPF0157 family)
LTAESLHLRPGTRARQARLLRLGHSDGVWQDMTVEVLTAAGLGLDYDTIRLDRTTAAWLIAGTALRDQLLKILDGAATDVELIGSSSALGLLAKPIIDLAVGLTVDHVLSPVTPKLEAAGWIYRGDAGDNGGHVFVLETRPRYRVAHLHVVEHDASQWRNYLCFRDLLRQSPVARERYEAVNLRLAEKERDDRKGLHNWQDWDRFFPAQRGSMAAPPKRHYGPAFIAWR